MTDDPTPTPPPVRSGRWLRGLLFVSLALNLLIVGMVAGSALSRQREDRGPDRSLVRDLGLGPFLWALDPADREALKRDARAQSDHLRKRRGDMRRAFGATLKALRTEPFDPTILADLIQSQARTAEQGRSLGQELLVRRIAGMTPEERSALADRLEKAVRRHGPRRSH